MIQPDVLRDTISTPSLSCTTTPSLEQSPSVAEPRFMPESSPADLNEHALSSTETSPVGDAFAPSMRRQEVEGEAANALMFQRSPLRRSSARSRPLYQFERNGSTSSLNSILPWNTGSVPTRKISVSSIASSTRPGPRRASTAMNPSIELVRSFDGLQRRPSQLSVRMRRESVAEKTKSHENLVQSPEIIGGPFEDVHNSPGARSHWSDNSDNEEEDEKDNDPESPVLGPLLRDPVPNLAPLAVPAVAAAAAIGEEDEGSIHISMARRVSRASSNTAMLPIFLRASKMSREASASRRQSVVSMASLDGNSKQTDLVRLVTALQTTHLEETRRLNEIIAGLSTKVAALERDLMYASASGAPVPTSQPFGTSSYPPYSSPRNSLTPSDVKWKTGSSIGGHYRFDSASPLDGPGCGRRMSAISSSSPRTAALNYI